MFSNINLNDAPSQEQVHINIPLTLEDKGDTQAFLLTPSNQLTYSDMITPLQAQLPSDLTTMTISTSQLSQSVTQGIPSEVTQTIVTQTESKNEEPTSVAICKKCNQGFQSIALYNSHQKIHESRVEHFEFSIFLNFLAKEFLKYKKCSTLHESESNTSYADSELGNTFTCPEDGCAKKYKTEHLLRRHLKPAVYFIYAHRYVSHLYVYFFHETCFCGSMLRSIEIVVMEI